MIQESNYMGYDGFIWWVGVVEDRMDPLKLGRCRVRIAGGHTADKSLIPTASLPWAQVLLPVTDTSMLMIKEGDYVVGFYLDGPNAQHPVIMGILPGIPDQKLAADQGFSDARTSTQLQSAPREPKQLTLGENAGEQITITEQTTADRNPLRLNEPTISRLLRNDGTTTIIDTKKKLTLKGIPIAAGGTFDEPDSSYGAVYPYNRVIETESGHVIELDDTPGKERVHFYHRSGTSIEINPDGTYINHVNADKYDVVLAEHNIFVGGNCNLTVNRNVNLKSGADINIEAEKSVNIKAGKGVNIQSGTSLSIQSQGPAILQAQDSLTLFGSGAAILQGSSAQIQPGLSAPIPGKLLGELGEPVKLNSTIATVSGTAPVAVTPTPPPAVVNMEEEGNQELAARPGTKLDADHPVDQYTPPVEDPPNLPIPTAATEAANTVSKVIQSGDILVRAMNRAKVQDPTQRAMIWAQCVAESGRNFKAKVENTMYKRETLLKIFPSYFTESNVDSYAPKKIGDEGQAWTSRAYGNRMGNGTESSQDGWKYRGRGLIQITGKANYKAASKAFNQDFVTYPDAMTSPDLAADIAVWFFIGKHGKGPFRGDYSNVLAVTRYVNGCANQEKCTANAHMLDRAKYFEEAKTKPEVTTYSATVI